jgi:hypothetical protein
VKIQLIGEGPIRRTREGGSKWEPIKILLEGDADSNKTNPASNTSLRLTTQVGQIHATTGVQLNLGTKSQARRLENAVEHKTRVSWTYTGQAGDHHWSDRSQLVKTGNFHRNSSIPVRPVQHTSQTGLSQKAPKHQTGLPSSKLNQTRNSSNTEQQRTHPNVHPSKNPTRVAPVRLVRGTGQTGVTWASRDEHHLRVNTPKSKPQSPESLHGLEQDFGDSRNTS